MNSNNLAMVKRHAMLAEAQLGDTNPYHYRHINQFCDYADCVAEAVKEEIRAELPRMIQEALKQPKVQLKVDEASLKRVKEKVEDMLSGLFGKR